MTKMWLQTLIVLTCVSSFEFKQLSNFCNQERTLYILRRSTYDFSVRLLDKVLQDTDGHFVFSPLATWVQLASLAEGARDQTLEEIWKITKHHRRTCLKLKWRKILNVMQTELRPQLKLNSVMVIDRLLSVKHRFLEEVELLNKMEVILYNFNNKNQAATKVNRFVEEEFGDKLSEILYASDFNYTTLLTTDVMYYKGEWKFPFNPSYTEKKIFYSEESDRLREVPMMRQQGYFNMTEIMVLRSKVLELPCGNDNRVSMLIILPNEGETIWNVYFYMQRIKLMSIFRLFENNPPQTLVNVELPRFNISTDYDNLPELLFDMGAKRMFRPETAQFKGITDYTVFASLMTQMAHIEVTEAGVEAESVAQNLILGSESVNFIVNKPFVFMLVDRVLELPLFAGAYKNPPAD